MQGDNFRDILAFLEVAKERSFTRAAMQLGVTQSALSHTIRGLEARLGVRLLTRTTRSVSPTEAGTHLMQRVGPRFDSIARTLAEVYEPASSLAGTVRITTSDLAFHTVLWPRLSEVQHRHPEIHIDIAIHAEFVDIAAERFDAGVRFGDAIAKGMTSIRVSPDIRMVVVGAPSYFEKYPRPNDPSALTMQNCINMRFSSNGPPYQWELKKGRRQVQVRVTGSWTFNSVYAARDAVLAGLGLAYMPELLVEDALERGELEAVLKSWSPTFPGLHLYYPTGQQSPALATVVESLRLRP